MADFKELAQIYTERRRAYEDSRAEMLERKSALDNIKRELARGLLDAGLDKIAVDGATFAPDRAVHYSCPAASREALLEQLETDGYRGAFTVNPNTLNTIMREMAEQSEDGQLPENYAQLVSRYEDIDLSVRGFRRAT